jgi:hypothetical protein
MCFKYIFLLSIAICFASDYAFSQQNVAKKDTTQLYKKIETYSKQRKFTKLMYSFVFKPVATSTSKKKLYGKLIVKPYSAFEGKIIRRIDIVTLDPFGYSIADTIVAPESFLAKTGNNLHIKSLSITIRNLLLIRKNQLFDSLLVKESERLVRSREYIRDVSFFVKSASKNSDSVDIFIRALDIWSIVPNGSASASSITVGLTDQNFLGFGHTFQNVYGRDYTKGNNSFAATYAIPNFRNSYVGAILHYDMLEHENFNRQIAIDRPFFSPFAKWAAGISITQQYRLDSIRTSSLVYLPQRIQFNVQDYWAGNAIQLYKGNSEYVRTTNFISAVRFLRLRYLEKPTALLDPLNQYFDENLYLGSIGISTRKYVQDKYIFKFGITEDVPIGKALSLTGGFQTKNNRSRPYLGARVSFGNYKSWGYLSSNIEYGTYFEASHPKQGILSAGLIYFTGLMEVGKWKFRQFVKPQIAIGMNLSSYDTLTMNVGHGLDGFNAAGLSGTGRLLLTLQTQAYAPWSFIGFRFGPFLNITLLDMLGDSSSGSGINKLYSQIGIGLLIKNENLVLNAFQISIAFYPSIPGKDHNVLKTNSFRTNDLGFRDFEIGKPGIVTFQ